MPRFLALLLCVVGLPLAAADYVVLVSKETKADPGWAKVVDRLQTKYQAQVLTYQADAGGWPKNTDTVSQPYVGDRAKLQPTFDNKGTVDELRFMARMVNATKAEAYRQSFDRGLAYVLKAQYANGGWPQFFPLRQGYFDHITFNDGAMVRVLEFVREVGRDERYAFLDAKLRASCRQAFDRGIACILKCQIVVDGRPAVWCAQHDEKTFGPAKARSYELPSFSGSESVGIVRLLMSLENPSAEIRASVPCSPGKSAGASSAPAATT